MCNRGSGIHEKLVFMDVSDGGDGGRLGLEEEEREGGGAG